MGIIFLCGLGGWLLLGVWLIWPTWEMWVGVPLSIDSVPTVIEYANLFPTDLPGLHPERDIDFGIDLEPDTRPIFILPYRMAPPELSVHLEDLLGTGFIRPCVLPWVALVQFVKKNGTMRMSLTTCSWTRWKWRIVTKCLVLMTCFISISVTSYFLRFIWGSGTIS